MAVVVLWEVQAPNLFLENFHMFWIDFPCPRCKQRENVNIQVETLT